MIIKIYKYYNDLFLVLMKIYSQSSISQTMSREEFVQLLADKANILKKHLRTTQSDLVICANIRPNTASFKLYNIKEENSLLLLLTISNLGDIEEQLYQLWVQLNFLLWEYCPMHFFRNLNS